MDQIKTQLVQFIFKIRNLSALATSRLNSHPAGLDINLTEFFLMQRVVETDSESNFNLQDIQDSFFISKSGVSKMLAALEKKEYLVRDTNRNCRRNVIITLTEKGREVIQLLEDIVDDYLNEYISHLGADDIKQLITITERLEKGSENIRDNVKNKYFAAVNEQKVNL